MVGWTTKLRRGPIGVDIGSRSIKLLQFDADRTAVAEAARWDLPFESPASDRQRDAQIVEAITRAREGRDFRGRKAVFCLGAGDLFVQNLRVPQASGDELTKIVHCEAAGRLPFGNDEAEIRYLEAADVRQGDTVRREVILLACRREQIERIISLAEQTGLSLTAIDVEPTALLRRYGSQFRRNDDQQRRLMFVNVGAANTVVVIARGTASLAAGGPHAMFVKYVDVGGRHLDEAMSQRLKMSLADAAALRRHNGDRRVDQRDPEIEQSIAESIRPVLDRLAAELSMCFRYYSVTFRGQPLSQLVLGGGEASQPVADWLSARLDLACQLGNPLRDHTNAIPAGRIGQWDVAAGLALREVN